MSSIDLSGRQDEDPPGIPRTGPPGSPASSPSSFSPEIEHKEHTGISPTGTNTQKLDPEIATHKLKNSRNDPPQSSTQNLDTQINTHKSEREKSPGFVSEIMNILGFGKSKNSSTSINSRDDHMMEQKYAEILKIDNMESINRNDEKTEEKNDEQFGTPKRALPDISFDQFREEEAAHHTRRRSGEFSFTSEIPMQKKPPNPRILILDFKENNASNVQLVRRALINFTEIRNFSIKVLMRGGISILFAKPKARDFASKILTEKLATHLATRRGFLKNKKVFEVITTVSKSSNLDEMKSALSAVSFKAISHNRVIFSLNTPEEASKVILDGFFYDSIHYEFQPFVYKPKVACKCGSIYHTQCTETDSKDNGTEEPLPCGNCKQTDHSTKQCILYKERLQTALANKKKTYAEALKVSSRKQNPATLPRLVLSSTTAPQPQLFYSTNDNYDFPFFTLKVAELVLHHFKVETNRTELEHAVDLAITSIQFPSNQTKQKETAVSSTLPTQGYTSSHARSNLAPKKPLSKYSVYTKPITGSQESFLQDKAVLLNTSNSMDAEETLPVAAPDTLMEEKKIQPDEENQISPPDSESDDSSSPSRYHRGSSGRGRGRGGRGASSTTTPRPKASTEKPKPKPKAKPDFSNFPKCGCGHVYKQVHSWLTHWNPKKSQPCPRQEVRCNCGRFVLTPMNYNGFVKRFNEHLNSSLCKKP